MAMLTCGCGVGSNDVKCQWHRAQSQQAATAAVGTYSQSPSVDWPRWFAQDFVRLYEQVADTDPDIREEYGKWAHNARVWLAADLARLDLRIGEAVVDANGTLWWVLTRPDGSGTCDGSFAAADYSHRQRYGEHMVRPVSRADHRCTREAPCSRPLVAHCPPMPPGDTTSPPVWSRLLCLLGFHPYSRLDCLAVCQNCGRYVR